MIPQHFPPSNIMAIANSAHIANLLTEALNTANDNGEKPRHDGYIKSMSGDLRTAARRIAKELGYDNATVSSSKLKEILTIGATQGPGSMIQILAVDVDHVVPFAAEEKTEEPVAYDAPPFGEIKQPAAPAGKAAVIQQMQELMAQALAPDNTVNGVSEQDVIALIEKYAHKPAEKNIVVTLPAGKKVLGEKLVHEQFDSVLKAVAAEVPVMLVGPAGSGKTTICEQVAQALDLRFYFTGAVASEYKLSGFVDAQGRIVSTAFRDAYTNGGLFLFDEVDASMPQAIMAFNAALANGHCDFPGDTEPTKRHPDFRVVAAANTFGRGADRQYVGRNQLDAASLDRFVIISMDYDEKLERALAGNTDWARKVQRIRREISKQQLRHIVSPRASIQGARLLAAGFSIDEVLESTVWKGLDKDSKARVLANIVG